MKILCSCCVLLILVVTPVFSQAQEPLALYDNFNEEFFDVNKWFGSDLLDSGNTVDVFVRVIDRPQLRAVPRPSSDESATYANGRLRLANRTYRNLGSSDIGSANSQYRLRFAHSEAIKSIQATVEVQGVHLRQCYSSSEYPLTRARIFGYFFNTGTPTPDSQLNDVYAHINVRQTMYNPLGVMEVYGQVLQCLDQDCNSTTQLGRVDLGTMGLGEKVKLRMTWDPDNDRFIFRKGNLQAYAPYTVSDAYPPSTANNKSFNILHQLPNCSTSPRAYAYMDVFFDDVLVNQSAVP
jgi:hypothetical protein